MTSPHVISIDLVFPTNMASFRARSMRVQITDASMPDSDFLLITQHKFDDVLCTAGNVLEMNFELPTALQPYDWVAQAHVSVMGDETHRHGDLVTTKAYPVKSDTVKLMLELVQI